MVSSRNYMISSRSVLLLAFSYIASSCFTLLKKWQTIITPCEQLDSSFVTHRLHYNRLHCKHFSGEKPINKCSSLAKLYLIHVHTKRSRSINNTRKMKWIQKKTERKRERERVKQSTKNRYSFFAKVCTDGEQHSFIHSKKKTPFFFSLCGKNKQKWKQNKKTNSKTRK